MNEDMSRRVPKSSFDEKTVFVISPIGEVGSTVNRNARLTLNFIIRKAFAKPEWAVHRADEEDAPDSITAQVIKRIADSDLIVADLTGHNPNVFYELAVAHGFKKPVIHLMTKGERLPFDVTDQRAVFYDLQDPESVDSAIKALRGSQQWLQDHPDEIRNPLSTYGAFESLSAHEPGAESNARIAEALASISARIGRLENDVRWAPGPTSVGSHILRAVGTTRSAEPDREDLLEKLLRIEDAMADLGADADPDDDAVQLELRYLGRERQSLRGYLFGE
ncbi:hypothetical protein [Curtobacterium sp. MCSS17_015]|uniref:hypothetical protein n=1 Tax=Curtobacterium sp. MCSS17_015 TaxID=2175666 RepID=UPI000DAAA146|nr:hypothetical protein [Curtobacterium sp. MCSS17_015]WIB25417.1 hypothetical protein DEJ18_10145 [Curtobacterium sp. MCSS17_015]